MKKLMMIAAMMVAAVSANAQFEPGTWSIQPKVGGIVSKVSNMPNINLGQFDLPSNAKLDRSFYAGALIGAEFEYQVAQPFSLAAGVNFAMQGCQWDDFEYKVGDNTLKLKDTKMELTYLNVPVVANFYLFKGFAIKAGVQVGFLTSAKMKMSSEVKIGDQTTKSTQDTDIKDGCKKVDFSIPMGVSYQVPTIPIYIDARYNLGLTNINKEGDTNYKNQVFQLTVGYKFAL